MNIFLLIFPLVAVCLMLYRCFRLPESVQRLRLERLLWRNQWQFARRHLRYGWIALLIAAQRLLSPQRGRLLVRGFVFLQTVDDLMDGDRPCAEPPAVLAERLIAAWQAARFDGADDLMLLAAAFHEALQQTAHPDAARAQAGAVLAVMRSDCLRAADRALWTAEQLAAHHRRTFGLSFDLLFAALPSAAQAEMLPELLDALGWCSTARDLREDVQAGIMNIPLEVWRQLPAADPRMPDTFLRHPVFADWLRCERRRALALLDRLEQRLPSVGLDAAGERMVRLFARSVRSFAGRRFRRLYPWV